jgi:hypothetical protein
LPWNKNLWLTFKNIKNYILDNKFFKEIVQENVKKWILNLDLWLKILKIWIKINKFKIFRII